MLGSQNLRSGRSVTTLWPILGRSWIDRRSTDLGSLRGDAHTPTLPTESVGLGSLPCCCLALATRFAAWPRSPRLGGGRRFNATSLRATRPSTSRVGRLTRAGGRRRRGSADRWGGPSRAIEAICRRSATAVQNACAACVCVRVPPPAPPLSAQVCALLHRPPGSAPDALRAAPERRPSERHTSDAGSKRLLTSRPCPCPPDDSLGSCRSRYICEALPGTPPEWGWRHGSEVRSWDRPRRCRSRPRKGC